MTAPLSLLSTPKSLNGAASARSEPPRGMVTVALHKIADNPYQTRSAYDPKKILNLAASLKALKTELPATRGLQQVPLARAMFLKGDGSTEMVERHWYEDGRAHEGASAKSVANLIVQLAFGHSRLRAFMLLCGGLRYALTHNHMGIDFRAVAQVETDYADLLDPDPDYATMPLLLGFALDHSMWEHAVTENAQRDGITPIDEALTLRRAIDEFGLTTEQAARPFGWQRSTAANKLRLLDLPADIQKQLASGDLSERHGRALLPVAADPARVRTLAEKAIKGKLNVRQLEESVKWEEKGLQEEQQKARESAAAAAALAAGWTLPGQSAGVQPAAVTDLPDYKLHEFDRNNSKHVALIEQGICGPHCACFAVGYCAHRYEHGYRPDPTKAPHVVAACTDYSARNDKVLKLATTPTADRQKIEAEIAERKRQAAELNNAAHALWQSWLRDQNKQALWSDLRLWRTVTQRVRWHLGDIFEKAQTERDALNLLLVALYDSTDSYNPAYGASVHTLEDVKTLIKELGGKVTVSQETAKKEKEPA